MPIAKFAVRALAPLAAACAFAAPASTQSRQLFGYAGVLGEWELTATVVATGVPPTNELSGPMTMTHVGLCARDGPDEKTSDIRLRLSPSFSQLQAALSIAGVVCTFTGTMSDAYKGLITCPDREPVPLTLWLK